MKSPKKPSLKGYRYRVSVGNPKEPRIIEIVAKSMCVNNRGDLILSEKSIYDTGIAAFRCNSWHDCQRGEPVFDHPESAPTP